MAEDRHLILKRVLELRKDIQQGEVPALREDRVPLQLHSLIADAHALGASDEAVQEELVEELTSEYVDDLRSRVVDNSDILDQWLSVPTGAAVGYERVAFINMR